MVAIPRDRGGVIACQLSVEAEQDFKYLTAMESAKRIKYWLCRREYQILKQNR